MTTYHTNRHTAVNPEPTMTPSQDDVSLEIEHISDADYQKNEVYSPWPVEQGDKS